MNTQKIYRLEFGKTGTLYDAADHTRSSKLQLLMDRLNWEHSRFNSDGTKFRPAIWMDFPSTKDYGQYKSGAASIEQLKSWFGEFWKPLLRNRGVSLVDYASNEVVEGKSGLQIFAYEPNNRQVLDKTKYM